MARTVKKAIVWFKKDLRIDDHRPLYEACTQADEVIGLYIYEPEWFESYEFDVSHFVFLKQSLIELKNNLAIKNIQLVLRIGNAHEVFSQIHKEYNYTHVFAHQETGVDWTYQRDLKVQSYFKSHQIYFKEYLQFAVIRKLKNRDLWNSYRQRVIERGLCPEVRTMSRMTQLRSCGVLQETDFHLPPTQKKIQPGGEASAFSVLESFLSERSTHYLADISTPQFAQDSSSRLSPYLSFGNISLTRIHHALQNERRKWGLSTEKRKSLWAFENRLWWHCHFIQKLETEPVIEFENVNRSFDGLRESEFNDSYFEAWKRGETGYPMIDASMRCLLQTSWINFRMRAMLVSFASYQLWLHWRKPGEFLAKHFLDFEPGIHWSQFQMQSGVTGINSIRIYSPIKQALDQRGAAEFIRTYCPELVAVPDEYIHEPHLMPPLFQMETGFRIGVDYPEPIVDHKNAYDLAKKRIFEWRKKQTVKMEAQKVLQKHGSRNANNRTKASRFPKQNREVIFGNFSKTQK